MKTILKSAMSIIIFTMLFAWRLNAQEPIFNQTVSKSSPAVFSKNFSSKITGRDVVTIEKINPKLLSRFNKDFPGATNIKWQQLGDNYMAIFDEGEATTKSLFDKKGRIIYTIINYSSEKQLPSDIKNLVKDNYNDYIITSVAKVLQDSRKIWVVKLSGQFRYKTVRVENGEIEEVENFLKSN